VTGRWAVVICVAAVGVMALGAQMATAGEPNLRLSGDKTQNPQDDKSCHDFACDVLVGVRCGDEECTARGKGKLTNIKNDKLRPDTTVVPPGKTRDVVLKLNDGQREHVRKALDRGETVKAKVTVRAKDAAGNVATAKRTIKLV
jgi:hypothetical protein